MQSSKFDTIRILAMCAGLCLAGCRAIQTRGDPNDANDPTPRAKRDRREAGRQATANAGAPRGVTDERMTRTSGPRDVILRPGDEIEVKFFYTPELDVTQAVRPDGKIALQLVGEITVEGKTPDQVRGFLLHLYESHLKEPKITILLKSQYDRRVYVGGEVVRPGVIEMPGDMTAAEAVMEAGGFDMEEAKPQNVVVIRQTAGQWQGFTLDLKPLLRGGVTEPFYLHPRDIVYVPRTRIAEIDQWVEQHINKLIPRIPVYFSVPNGD